MGNTARDDSGCTITEKEKAKAKKEIILERQERRNSEMSTALLFLFKEDFNGDSSN